MNGILTLNSGLPTADLDDGEHEFLVWRRTSGRIRRAQNAAIDNPTLDRWFDTTAFRLPAQYTFGNMGRMHPSLRSDFVENLDFSVFKRVPV